MLSCGLLLLPVFVWNAMFMGSLPPAYQADEFWRDIPAILGSVENTLRLLVFALPFLMPLNIETARQRSGLTIFITGNLLYFASWLALMLEPQSWWSHSALGFLAPAYTPMIWFAGLAMSSNRLFWGSFYRWWMYLAISGIFLSAHLVHAVIVYLRNY